MKAKSSVSVCPYTVNKNDCTAEYVLQNFHTLAFLAIEVKDITYTTEKNKSILDEQCIMHKIPW